MLLIQQSRDLQDSSIMSGSLNAFDGKNGQILNNQKSNQFKGFEPQNSLAQNV